MDKADNTKVNWLIVKIEFNSLLLQKVSANQNCFSSTVVGVTLYQKQFNFQFLEVSWWLHAINFG